VLSPRHFVDVRTTFGGPAPGETARAHALSEATLASDAEWFASAIGKLRLAEEQLKEAVATL
jgi:hypothetical protein